MLIKDCRYYLVQVLPFAISVHQNAILCYFLFLIKYRYFFLKKKNCDITLLSGVLLSYSDGHVTIGAHPRRCYSGTQRTNAHVHPPRQAAMWSSRLFHSDVVTRPERQQASSQSLTWSGSCSRACKRALWWWSERVSSLRWKHDISCEFYSQGLQNCQHATSTFSENHRAQRPACLHTAIVSFKEARCLRWA